MPPLALNFLKVTSLKAVTALKAFLPLKAIKALTPLNKRNLARFSNQLYMLLKSGVPLLESLQIMKNMSKKQTSVYDQIITCLSNGSSFSESIEPYFPPTFTHMIASAEQVGELESALKRLAQYYEKRAEVEEKTKSALVYPAFVIFLSLVLVIVLFFFILPGFQSLFADFGTELPLFTKVFLSLPAVLSKVIFLMVTLGLGLFFYLRQGTRWAICLLKLKFYTREQLIQAFRTWGSLLDGGVSILVAFTASINGTRNAVFRNILTEVKLAVENGQKLSSALSKYNYFPTEAIQMIAVGENSGALGQMLTNIADFYDKERELFIKRSLSLLEPALTLFVGLMVGMIAIAMFLPMINMISTLQ